METAVTALKGANVFVTGGSRGIGKALVKEVYARGAGKVCASLPPLARHSSDTALKPASEPSAGGTLHRIALHSRNAPEAGRASQPNRARRSFTLALHPSRFKAVPTACP